MGIGSLAARGESCPRSLPRPLYGPCRLGVRVDLLPGPRHHSNVSIVISAAIPTAPFDDLDLGTEQGELEWERRVGRMALQRITDARRRLARLGIIDANGQLVSTEMPRDMDPDSDATVETG